MIRSYKFYNTYLCQILVECFIGIISVNPDKHMRTVTLASI